MRFLWGIVCAVMLNAQVDEWRSLMDRGSAQEASGRYAAAAELYREAVHIAESLLPGDRRLPSALNSAASAYDAMGKPAEAERQYKRALALAAAGPGKNSKDYGIVANNLAAHYVEQRQADRAEPLARDAISIFEAADPPDDLHLATAENTLASVELWRGDYESAAGLLARVTDLLGRTRETPPELAATPLNSLGVLRLRQHRYGEATELLERALSVMERAAYSGNPRLVRFLNNLALAYAYSKRNAEADATFRRALSVAEAGLGTEHPIYASVLLNYADFLRNSGRRAQARPLEARAKAILKESARANGAGVTVDVTAFVRR